MRAALTDSLEFLYPDSKAGARPCGSMAIDVARGATAGVHVLLNDLKKGEAVRCAVRGRGGLERSARWFRLIDVPVEVNTGLHGFTEKTHKRNRFVIRRAPFRVYDAMEPVRSRVEAPGATMALRLHLPIRPDERPGRRTYAIEIRSGREECTLSLAVRVHSPVIPPVGRESWPYTNWFSYDHVAARHGLKLWGEAYWRMLRRYAELMVRTRQNTFWIPLGLIFRTMRGRQVLDRGRLRRIVKTCTDAGMHFIEGGHFARLAGPVLQAKTLCVGEEPVTSCEGHAALAAMARQLADEIDRNDWRDRWIQHAADEPGGPNAPDYRILVGMIHKYMPGIPVVDAVLDTALTGSVDVWCPTNYNYQKDREFFESQRVFGDRIWSYTCCTPGGPWLNRLLDMELLRPALLGWAAALYGLDGFLHWGLNHYRADQDPFRCSGVDGRADRSLPAGDTHVVYPGPAGPWSSLRFEAQREGFEDYELLRQLKARRPRAAARIIAKVIRSFDDYTKDVTVFRAARKALLEAIDR